MQVPGVAKSVAYGTVYTAVHVRIAPTGRQGRRQLHAAAAASRWSLHAGQDHDRLHRVRRATGRRGPVAGRLHPGPGARAGRLQPWRGAAAGGAGRAPVAHLRQPWTSAPGYDRPAIYRAVLAVQGVEYAELEWLNITAPVDDTDPGQGDTDQTFRAHLAPRHQPTMGDPGTGKYRRNNVTTRRCSPSRPPTPSGVPSA